MSDSSKITPQITLQNGLTALNRTGNTLTEWMEAYFHLEVTTLASSQKEQRRDLQLLISYVKLEAGNEDVDNWTPRLSSAFKKALQTTLKEDGSRRWNDRSINRILAHLKTFTKWIHKHKPFRLGNPMDKIKGSPAASLLSIERALTPTERRRILDAADLLLETGGLSKDRNRYGNPGTRPKRKGYRPYRNRAIIYTLIETGMRRAAITNINTTDVNSVKKTITTTEKGSYQHEYMVSHEGLAAINDYITNERALDADSYDTRALFLPAGNTQNKTGRLHPNAINEIWDQVCETAGVKSKTPHSARHSMGRYLIEKTGNVAAVQRQLGHKNAAYSLQYSRITNDELSQVLDERD